MTEFENLSPILRAQLQPNPVRLLSDYCYQSRSVCITSASSKTLRKPSGARFAQDEAGCSNQDERRPRGAGLGRSKALYRVASRKPKKERTCSSSLQQYFKTRKIPHCRHSSKGSQDRSGSTSPERRKTGPDGIAVTEWTQATPV